MNLLNKARFYLSGPIERSTHHAHTWRRDLSDRIHAAVPGAVIWDPLVKPSWMIDINGPQQQLMRECVEKWHGNDTDNPVYKDIRKQNKMIRNFGMSMAVNCDIIIIKIDDHPTVGSIEELVLGQYKPVFVLTDGKKLVPSMWMLDLLDAYDHIGFVFHRTVDSLVNTIAGVDRGGPLPDNFRWMFLTNQGDKHAILQHEDGSKPVQ